VVQVELPESKVLTELGQVLERSAPLAVAAAVKVFLQVLTLLGGPAVPAADWATVLPVQLAPVVLAPQTKVSMAEQGHNQALRALVAVALDRSEDQNQVMAVVMVLLR
jgi:hypothetical protein